MRVVIVGKTASGKTAMLRKMIESARQSGNKVTVYDTKRKAGNK